EQLRGSAHAEEGGACYLEQAELVRRAKSVLRGAQDSVGVVAIALELEHAVDEVLEHARTRDGAVLGHVPDEESRDVRFLGDPEQARRRFPDLRDRARSGADL